MLVAMSLRWMVRGRILELVTAFLRSWVVPTLLEGEPGGGVAGAAERDEQRDQRDEHCGRRDESPAARLAGLSGWGLLVTEVPPEGVSGRGR